METDRRHIRRRIAALRARLEQLEQRRRLLRERRKKEGFPTVAIVGYTNVGKSTLLNALTQAGVLAEDKLFATLDPTSRALDLPDGRRVMLIDTVGLVRRLPHQLVEAFHSTLEAAAQADLCWCVCDIASPQVREQIAVTKKLLEDLGATAPLLTVLNKGDLVAECPLPLDGQTAVISARTGFGLDRLLELTAQALPSTHQRMRLLFPYDKAGLIHALLQEGKVFSQEYLPEGILVEALVERRLVGKVLPYQIEKGSTAHSE